MECSCSIAVDFDYSPSFYREKYVVARKSHKCSECRSPILSNTRYRYCVGQWDGALSVYKICPDCDSIINEFFPNGFMFRQVWDYLYNHVEECVGDVPENCMLNLTPVAKSKLADIIERFHDDDDDEE